MIILIGASSGLGNYLISDLSKIDEVIAFYNSKKPNVKKKYNKIYYEKINFKKNNNFDLIFKKYSKKLINTKVVCINLAAVTLDKLLVNIKKKDISHVFEINVFSNFLITKSLVPFMLRKNWGRFIHFTSTKAILGDVGITIYSSSKSSLLGFSNCLAKEYGQFNITSNIISLGYFNSPLWQRLSREKKIKLLDDVPSNKTGNPKDILNTIKFIIGTDYLNASVIKLDGGI